MTYITGDFHGDVFRFCARFPQELSKDDTIIVLGDSGLNYSLSMKDYLKKEFLRDQIPCDILIVHGNHERYAPYIDTYKNRVDGLGSYVSEDDFPNLKFLIDGNVYHIPDGKGGTLETLVLGGAYSVDKWIRLEHGWEWFTCEQIPKEKREKLLKNYIQSRPHFDMILTHTCPKKWVQEYLQDLLLPQFEAAAIDNTTEEFLDEVEKAVTYDGWYFGHYHSNRDIGSKSHLLYDGVLRI